MIGSAHRYEIQILEHHLDTFGHVNNAVYLALFEEARWDLITQNGYGLDEVMRRRVGPTILEVNLRFMKELKNRERFTIETWLESYGGKVGKIGQRIVDASGTVYCEAMFTFGLFDLTARKLIKPTPEWLVAVGVDPSTFSDSAAG